MAAAEAPSRFRQKEAQPEVKPRTLSQEEIEKMPIKQEESSIKSMLHNDSQIIVVGQTGSGKTTLLPLFTLDVISNNGQDAKAKMVLTQPRKVAVDNAADTIGGMLGVDKVGVRYKGYRGRHPVTSETNMDVMVVGSMLNLLVDGIQDGTLLKEYGAVMVDEVHEESIDSQLALVLLKKVQELRRQKKMPPLKIILASGSVDLEKLKRNFPDAVHRDVEGRTYEVTDHFSDKPIAYEDMPAEAARIVVDILADPEKDGNILAIMPGRSDIDATIRSIQQLLQVRTDIVDKDNIEIIPVTGGERDRQQQKKLLGKSAKRQVFVGTPVVEASVTIDNLGDLVDSGKVKVNMYDEKTGLSSLHTVDHTQANWKQRRGRAGRVAPGHGWYLFTEAELNNRDPFPKPEIMHADLAALVLRMKQIGINNVHEFDYLDHPGKERLDLAVETLKKLGALDKNGKITDIGREMAEVPVDPHYARMLVEAKKRNCVGAVATLVGYLSSQRSPYSFNAAKASFLNKNSDYITFLNAWNGYVQNIDPKDRNKVISWCQNNGLNSRIMYEIGRTKNDLVDEDFAQELGVDHHHNSFDTNDAVFVAEIGKSIAAGFTDRLLKEELPGDYRMVEGSLRGIKIGRNSALSGTHNLYVVADAIAARGKQGILIAEKCQAVQEVWLKEIAPYLQEVKSLQEMVKVESQAVTSTVETPVAASVTPAVKESSPDAVLSELGVEKKPQSVVEKLRQATKDFLARIKKFFRIK